MEWLAIGAWLVVTAGLSVLGAPLAAAVFDRLPGRGGPFALVVSLVVLGLVSFWVGQLRYGWVALATGIAALAGLSAMAYRRGHVPAWTAVAEGYVVFLAGSALALAVRVTDNTIRAAGGEQFLHYGLLRAVGRADSLPPEDMWWAGESVNYYYGGHVLVDQLSRLAGTDPRLAYNLGFAVVFGLIAATAYGLVGGVVDAYGYRRRVGGAVAVAFVLLAGTLTTPVRLLLGHLPTDVATRFGGFAFEAIQFDEPLEAVLVDYASLTEWSWWYERRVVDGMLVETPLFSMVKGDLHGHVTTIPFMIALIAVAFAYYQTPPARHRRRWALLLLVLAPMAAQVGWMNTWSLPGAVGIAWLALAFAPAHPLSLLGGRFERDEVAPSRLVWIRDEATRLVGATVGVVAVGALGVALIAPFVLFQLPSNDGIGLVSERSPLGGHLLLFGGFFAVFALFLGVALWRRYATDRRRHRGVAIVAGATVTGAVLVAAGLGSMAVAAPLLAVAWWLLRRRPRLGFIGVLIVGTLGLILSMELVHAEVWPPDRERLNTTYKVSMQAMVFGLLATAAIVTALVSERLPRDGWRPTLGGSAILVAVIVLVVVLGTFPVLTLGGTVNEYAEAHPHVSNSVDALDGQERWFPEEFEAIAWLDAREGTPTILEAPGETIYHRMSTASTFTGLPSVVGWAHQRGYRGEAAYYERQAAVDDIYRAGGSNDPLAALEAFDVAYVWVGPNERDRYGQDLRDFGAIDGLSVAFDNGWVTIYAVEGG